MNCLLLTVLLLFIGLPGLFSCPRPFYDGPLASKSCEAAAVGKFHATFAEEMLKYLDDSLSPLELPCVTESYDELEETAIQVHIERFRETVLENNNWLLSTAINMLPGNSLDPTCFDKTIEKLKKAISVSVPEQKLSQLRTFRDKLNGLKSAALSYCDVQGDRKSAAALQPEKCTSSFLDVALKFYTQLFNVDLDAKQALSSLFVLKATCTVQFHVGAHMLSVLKQYTSGQHAKSLMATSRHIRSYLERDMTLCIQRLSATLDLAVQNWPRGSTPLPIALRAGLWQHFMPWMVAFKDFTGISDLQSGPGMILLNRGLFMLRDTGDPRNPNEWFSCSEGTKKRCFCTTCGGTGPSYNQTFQEAEQYKRDCSFEHFRIELVDPGENTPETSVKVNDLVQLYTRQRQLVYWGIVGGDYKAENGKTCPADYLAYIYDESKTPDRRKTIFKIQAWDWAGRQREAGEEIRDRDYTAFGFVETPEYRRLYQGYGMYYIEGMVFIAPS